MTMLTVQGRSITLNDEGYLADIDEWDREVAEQLAAAEGISMTEQHWEIAQYLHEYYKQYQIAPMIKILVRMMDRRFGPEKGTRKYVYELFPDGPAKQACKIAGLPAPTGCL